MKNGSKCYLIYHDQSLKSFIVFLNSGGWAKCAWGPLWMCGGGLVGAKVGSVGLGSIGLAVAKRLLPFEIAKIMYCGRHEKPEGINSLKPKYHSIIKGHLYKCNLIYLAAEVSGEYVTFDRLLSESDVVIITCPLNDTTRNMFGSAQFASMKPNAVLINTSRGGLHFSFFYITLLNVISPKCEGLNNSLMLFVTGVVDQSALGHALKTGQITAAGLDVMTPEPLPVDHELTQLKNCGSQSFVYFSIDHTTIKSVNVLIKKNYFFFSIFRSS